MTFSCINGTNNKTLRRQGRSVFTQAFSLRRAVSLPHSIPKEKTARLFSPPYPGTLSGGKERGTVFAFFDQLPQLNFVSILLRLALAMLFGGLIGLERERKRRPAGFRS